MRTRFIQISGAIVVALLTLALFTISLSLAAPAQQATAPSDFTSDRDETGATIKIRRAISIPFGIDSPLDLSQDGRLIHVTGHGTCQEGGETFDLRVTVRQEELGAQARSSFNNHKCGPDWAVEAETKGPATFTETQAQVCAMALVRTQNEGTIVNKWCKEVELQ